MYPLPIGLALVDMLAEHYEDRHERARLAREEGGELHPSTRRLPRRGARLVSRLGLRGRAVA